jgi:general secretion pathway protein L
LSTLYIRLPSKAAADGTPHWIALSCPFALVAHGDAIEREGTVPVSDLAESVARAQRVVLILAASDVTLLRVQVPPLSASRLKAALPNLVEDQLMTDPDECVLVAGESVQGLRTIAVINRGWLEILAKTFQTFGARNVVAVPAQLCLLHQAGSAAAAVAAQGTEIDLTVRLSEQDGIGLPIVPEQPESAPRDVVQTLCAVVPTAPINLYVPQAVVPDYQDAVNALLALEQRITVYADNWTRWIGGARQAAPDMLTGLGAAARPKIDWRPWRWSIALAAAVLVIDIAGLNIDWWRMKREADSLRATLLQTYKSAYPNETVIVDPMAQMRQKIAAARHAAGQLAPDDFSALAAHFGEAWERVGQGRKLPGIARLEYRDRSLVVRLKPGGSMPVEPMRAALAARNLSLASSADGAWQIRSAQ